jgi:cold shock CspA family protein
VKSGKVVSFSAEKRYGFIKTSDDESYFFHQSDIFSEHRNDIKRGAVVQFDDVPTPKGMTAKNVVSVQTYEIYIAPDTDTDVIISKSNTCGRDNEPVLSLGTVEVEHKDPDTAVNILKQKALAAGCNAVMKLQRGKRTGTAWTNTNYKYSIHRFTGEIALVKKKASTTDWNVAERNRVALEDEINSIKLKGTPSNESVFDAGPFGVVVFVIVLIVILIVFSGR